MGKPKGRNGFFQFLIHTQNQLKREGKNLGLNAPELQGIAGSQWSVMSKQEREPFEQKAKRSQSQTIAVTPRPLNQKVDPLGRIVANTSNEIDDDCGREEYCEKMVECCVKACGTRDQLMNASFFIVATNVMCRTDKMEFPPLEIGICQYSIASGIKFSYHEFIDAGKVPLGYMHSAKDWAETSHKIPLSDFYPATNNYEKLVEDMKQILEESRFTNQMTGKPTPMLVFCREDAIEQNRGVFQWLQHKYNEINKTSFEWDLEVLDLVLLLYYISKSGGHTISMAAGEDVLSSSAYDYSKNTLCDYHEEIDNRHCAQGLARRLCYMLTDGLCPMFGITPTDKHLPSKRDVIAETYKAQLLEVKPLPAYRYHQSVATDDSQWDPNQVEEGAAGGARPKTGIGRGRAHAFKPPQNN